MQPQKKEIALCVPVISIIVQKVIMLVQPFTQQYESNTIWKSTFAINIAHYEKYSITKGSYHMLRYHQIDTFRSRQRWMGYKGGHWLVHEECIVHIVVSQKASQAGVTSASEKFKPIIIKFCLSESISKSVTRKFRLTYILPCWKYFGSISRLIACLVLTNTTSLLSGRWFLCNGKSFISHLPMNLIWSPTHFICHTGCQTTSSAYSPP